MVLVSSAVPFSLSLPFSLPDSLLAFHFRNGFHYHPYTFCFSLFSHHTLLLLQVFPLLLPHPFHLSLIQIHIESYAMPSTYSNQILHQLFRYKIRCTEVLPVTQ